MACVCLMPRRMLRAGGAQEVLVHAHASSCSSAAATSSWTTIPHANLQTRLDTPTCRILFNLQEDIKSHKSIDGRATMAS